MTTVSKSLTSIRSLTVAERNALKKVGIDSTTELLAAAKTTKDEKALAKKAGISVDAVREAVNRADLLQVKGMGAATADLFENAGVNSATELAHRNAESLRQVLERFDKAHPELNLHLPSPKTIGSLIAKAKEIGSTAPVADIDEVKARDLAGAELHRYVDQVLFTDDPKGKNFREAVLSWRPEADWPAVKQKMHDDVANWVKTAEKTTDPEVPGSFWFSGGFFKLYTEVKVDKTGKILKTYVEID